MQVELNQVGSSKEAALNSFDSLPVPEAKLNNIAASLLSAIPAKTPEPKVLKGNNSLDHSSESDNEQSVEEEAIDWDELLADEVIDSARPLDLKGTFTVVSYPFCYKGSSLVSETAKFCGISTSCPWVDGDEDIVVAHLSAIMDGSIVIDLGNRKYTLTMEERRITRDKIKGFLTEKTPIERELDDPEWFKQKVFIPSSIKV